MIEDSDQVGKVAGNLIILTLAVCISIALVSGTLWLVSGLW